MDHEKPPVAVDTRRTAPSNGGRRPRRRLSVGGAAVWFAVSYGGAILGYLAVNAFAARLLDGGFGYFVIAVTVSTMLGQLGLVGVQRGGLREAARLRSDDVEGLRDLRRAVRAVSLLTLPATGCAAALVTFWLMDPSDSATRWTVAVGMGALVWLGGQQKLWANYLRGFGQVRFASLLEGRSGGMLTSAFQAVLVGAVLLLAPDLGLPGALGALAIGLAVPVFLAWRRVARLWRHAAPQSRVLRDLRMAVSRNWRFASNMLGGNLNSTVELWLAGVVLTSVDVSLFSASQRLAVLLAVPLTSLGVVFSPVIARLAGQDDVRLERLLRTGATLAAALTGVALIPMLVVPGPLLDLVYGDGFAAGASILLLLTVGTISNVMTGMCGTALTMSRHESVVATVQWVAVAVRIAAGVAAAILFGAVGLAVSAALVTTGLYGTLWWQARRRMGMKTHLTLRPSVRLLRQTSG